MDLKQKPFYLTDADIAWVEETRSKMSDDEKLRQLFCLVTYTDDPEYCRYIGETVRPGGFMSRRMTAGECLRAVANMQKYSAVPMLVAANFEAGGNGMITEGTLFASPMEVAATGDPEQARRLGEICGTEGRAVGANWAFAPIVDIDYNWRNPITNTRTFGSDPERVAQMGVPYLTEVQRMGLAACAKHFPGDGRDERDQHVAISINDLSCEEWDRTYGAVYSACIEAGVKTVMIGHILQPAYSERLHPGLRKEELMPASVSRELVTGLLREKLGFQGLVVTDSTTMAGIMTVLPRETLVPMTIAAGCDMFLFTKSLEEDLEYMRRGYAAGVFGKQRLDEAVTRILALKASMHLHEKQKNGTLVPPEREAARVVGQEKFRQWSLECAERAITLVKEEPGVLPLTPERYPRVLFYGLENRTEGSTVFNVNGGTNQRFLTALREAGFAVTEFQPTEGFEGMMQPVHEITDRYDLILYSASLQTKSNQTVVRIEWANPMGANVPVYTHTIPTVFISFENPYHLADVPHMRTMINCYAGSDTVIRALMNKLTGKSPFVGISPSDPFCGKWETRR